VPIPSHAELDTQRIADAIEEGLNQVKSRQLSGPQVTPVVLAEIEKVTRGDSVDANLVLAEHNADIAAQVALEIAQL
jgi:pseudouridine-5'-phosphate glycosidase